MSCRRGKVSHLLFISLIFAAVTGTVLPAFAGNCLPASYSGISYENHYGTTNADDCPGDTDANKIERFYLYAADDRATLGGSGSGYFDEVWGASGTETVFGQDGPDHIFGQGDDDNLFGGNGDDWIDGGGSPAQYPDVIFGGSGNDDLYGGDGPDRIVGDGKKDYIYDQCCGPDDDEKDAVCGGTEVDTIHVDDGNEEDIVYDPYTQDNIFKDVPGDIETTLSCPFF